MLDKEFIEKRLAKSFVELLTKKKGITPRDFQQDVVNWACLDIILEKNKNIGSGNMVSLNTIIQFDKDVLAIAELYTSGIRQIFEEYSETDAIKDIGEIQNKSVLPQMWDVLREYFKEMHDLSIDDMLLATSSLNPSPLKKNEGGEVTQEPGFSMN
jgi:hypothetical protein